MSSTCSEPERTSSGRRLYMQLWYVSSVEHSSTNKIAYTDECKTYHTVIVYTTIFLKMNPGVRNI
jgi:hypothetical protein